MEPLPSDVARLVLAYLVDTCPDVADQFLAKSPDLAEVRRMRPRAQRPFGPSLVDLLTEHATALSLVEDVTSSVASRGASVRNGDFLCKLRQLLSLVTGAKKDASVGPAELSGTVRRVPADPAGGGGGVRQGREAATAGHWACSPAPRDHGTCDEAPAVGGDCADSPVGEALQGDSVHSWEDSSLDSPLRRKCDRPAPPFGLDSSAVSVTDGGRQPGGDHAPRTELSPATTGTGRGDGGGEELPGRPLEGTGRPAGSGGGRDAAAVAGDCASDRPPELRAGGLNRRKARPPRRSSHEKGAVLIGTSAGGRPAGWIFGLVRHYPSVGRTAGAQEEPPSAERRQPQPDQDKRGVPSSPGQCRALSRASVESSAVPPSPAVEAGCSDSPLPGPRPVSPPVRPHTGWAARPAASGALAERPLSAAAAGRATLPVRPSARSAACPTAGLAVAGGHGARKGSAPRRRPPSRCGTVVVLPGTFPSRPPQSCQLTCSGEVSEPPRERREAADIPVESGRDAGSFAVADRLLEGRSREELFSCGVNSLEPAAKRAKLPASPAEGDGTSRSPIRGQGAAGALLPSTDAGCEAAVRCSILPSPGAGGTSVRSPSQQAESSPEAALSLAPDADSSDACSPVEGGATGGSRSPQPPGGAAVDGSPTVSQPSGRSSGLSDGPGDLERSTPFSQRSLRICLTPRSGETPSVNGSLLAEETPTSARQSARRGALKRSGPGGRSASGNIRAPRRRLLADLRLSPSWESPVLPGGVGQPLEGSTPTTSSAATRSRDVAGRVEGSSPGECPDVGRRRTPRRVVRRRPGPPPSVAPAVAPPSSGGRPPDRSPAPAPSAQAKIPSDGNNALLKSINIMSFLSRIHSAGSS